MMPAYAPCHVNFTTLHLCTQMELEEEKKKWEKERGDMQEQIKKLLQACMEEERESEMARRREASAREQLGESKHAYHHSLDGMHVHACTCRCKHVPSHGEAHLPVFASARLNAQVPQTQGGSSGPDPMISIPVTPTQQAASNDPMHLVPFRAASMRVGMTI